MTGGGRVLFGYFPSPEATAYPRILEHARLIDELGLDLIAIQDHPYQRRFLDALTLLTAIAVQTQRLRVIPDVVNLQMRPPAMLAKWAASLDVMSAGRVELGLGAGAFTAAVAAMGGDAREGGVAVSALEEAIGVIRLMWSGQRGVRFEGRFYQLRGVHTGPVPVHPIGIWLGAYRPRMLAITGRLADGWLPSLGPMGPDALKDASRQIDDAALAAGRSPTDILRIYNISGQITDGVSSGFLDGPVDQWIDQLTELTVDYGMDGFILGPADDSAEQLRRFATEVAPRVRENAAVVKR
ncbi:MAG TPA: LLM class flavin-dependent oxidoreductase [Candidatus Dormibacteraeota bacterium]|nr:LLM class flavin-dependent oxidoreductase [Candidatus Dormibacteraeota bacterium]